MNTWRKELIEMLPAHGRRAALRRSLREDALYSSDLPSFADEAEIARFRQKAEAAGWRTESSGGWIQLIRASRKPPEGWLEAESGEEAACCAALLRRHPGTGTFEKESMMLIKAGEEGAEAYEKACAALHAEWAARLRRKEALPSLDPAYFEKKE